MTRFTQKKLRLSEIQNAKVQRNKRETLILSVKLIRYQKSLEIPFKKISLLLYRLLTKIASKQEKKTINIIHHYHRKINANYYNKFNYRRGILHHQYYFLDIV